MENHKLKIVDKFCDWIWVNEQGAKKATPNLQERVRASEIATMIAERICLYVEKHGNISLQIGSEWMFQDDDAQVDALSLVGDVLDLLKEYAEDQD